MSDIEALRQKLKALNQKKDLEKEKRIKASKDFFIFVKTYFNRHINLPETSFFRKEFYKNGLNLTKKHRNLLFKAYRGAAKTTIISRFFVMFKQISLKQNHNCITISATISLSKKTLEFIKNELEDNASLIDDFNITKGEKWSEEEIVFYVGSIGFKISVYGASKKIRGENWRGFRPSLIVCDDLENDENVQTKSQRDKMASWFSRAVMKLPARDDKNYNIIVVGTTLHHDSLLKRLEKREDFASFSYPLVRSFPSNLDKFQDKELILDNENLDKKAVFKEYLQDKNSFMSEYQNEPLSRDLISFGGYKTYELMPLCDAYYIGIDPSLGKSKGDYFSICLLGFLNSKFYASVKMYKLKPELMIDKIISLCLDIFKLNRGFKIAIETVQFQEFFKDSLDLRARDLGVYLPIIPIKNSVAKELRIDSLSPYINNEQILIDKNSLTFIEELDTYPKSAHDDGLDSLEMAFRIAKIPNFDYEKVNNFLKDKETKRRLLNKMLILD